MPYQISEIERRIAARELVSFVQDYIALSELQLAGIRRGLADIVDEVMQNIREITETEGRKRALADQVLITENSPDGDLEFKSISSAERETKEIKENSNVKDAGEKAQALTSTSKLGASLGSLGELSSEVRQIAFKMVGALSADDVIGQRLSHVASANRFMADDLGEFLMDFEKNLRADAIFGFENALKTKIFSLYTMESEKDIFKGVYQYKSSQ